MDLITSLTFSLLIMSIPYTCQYREDPMPDYPGWIICWPDSVTSHSPGVLRFYVDHQEAHPQ